MRRLYSRVDGSGNLLRRSVDVVVRACEALLRVSLVLATWSAPLPVIHAHQVHTVAGQRPTADLWNHIHDFHEDAEESGVAFLNWHVHWLMPGDWACFPCHHRGDGSSGHNSEDRTSSILASNQAVPASVVASVPAPDEGAASWLPSNDVARTQSRGASVSGCENFVPRHYLASYQQSATLSQLLSVWRC